MRDQEAARQRIEAGMEPAREAVNAARLKEQEARLALSRFTEELAEAGADEAALQAKLGAGLKINSLMSEIARLSQAVNALGSVNLAALEELNTAREREQYLNAQAGDLLAAVETLENAIRRIDRETRALLQDTYNTVNANLQELFPLLFGGGHAELVLTGDEILDAGMSILAQPPGKKNSTIHLLSGGEKALTALSLVFSLFRLNPAPFCLLDEVDAPLDDANTLRFCELVKKNGRTHAVSVYQPQSADHGNGRATGGRNDAGTRGVTRGGGGYRNRFVHARCRNRLNMIADVAKPRRGRLIQSGP